MGNNATSRPAVAYKPCWSHHPRGGYNTGFACKVVGNERGIAISEEYARSGDAYTTVPKNQVFLGSPPA